MTSAAFGERVEELISVATARMNSDFIPGVQIGVIDGDSESVSSLGITDVRSRHAVSDDTLFRIGSITKTFTATVLVQLSQERRLGLDDRVRMYVPEFALSDEAAADRVTIRHLLLHTAGWQPHQEHVTDGPNALSEGARGQVHAAQFAPPGKLFSYDGVAMRCSGAMTV